MENMGLKNNFWFKKKVLITGHSGFKGSWLTLMLKELDSVVTGYALKPIEYPNLYDTLSISDHIHEYIGDIKDKKKLQDCVNESNPEIVFHLAAQPIVSRSFDNPFETFNDNIIETLNLLEICRNLNTLRVIVNVTTDKCYNNDERMTGYIEDDKLGGNDPYSASKACSELVTGSYAKSFFSKKSIKVGVATARAGNVIGGGDWAINRIVPDLMRAINKDEKIILRNPYSTRPWQHVFEPLYGYLILAQALYDNPINYTGGWNFGPPEKEVKTVDYLARKICNILDYKKEIIKAEEQMSFGESKTLLLNSKKSQTQLGWISSINIMKAIHLTCDWYDGFFSKSDIKELSVNQLNEFLSTKF